MLSFQWLFSFEAFASLLWEVLMEYSNAKSKEKTERKGQVDNRNT